MGRSSRPLPLVSTEWPFGSVLAMIVLGCALLAIVPYLNPFGSRLDRVGLRVVVGAFGISALGNAGFVLVERHVLRTRRRRWQERAATLGLLDYRERVAAADLEPYRNLPLFRFGDPDKERACCLASGVLAGQPLSVLHYRYGSWDQGVEAVRSHAQTVALFLDVLLPAFHLGAQESAWSAILPDWPPRIGLGRVVRVVNGYSANPILVRGKEEDVAGLFTPERIACLGDLEGWVIESRGGCVAVYRHKKVMETDALPAFVHRAVDLIAVLTAREETTEATSADERISPGQGRTSVLSSPRERPA